LGCGKDNTLRILGKRVQTKSIVAYSERGPEITLAGPLGKSEMGWPSAQRRSSGAAAGPLDRFMGLKEQIYLRRQSE